MGNRKYSMSFTTGGLFAQESVKIAKLYIEMDDWTKVKEKVLNENLLQSRTGSTAKRVCREIMQRLEMLSADELDFLVDTNDRNQRYLLWIAVCRRYKFIAEFAAEVLRERHVALRKHLHYEDFDSFFNRKAEYNRELEDVRHSTRKKLRQVLFKMLRESDLLSKDNEIKGAYLDNAILETIPADRRVDLACFPVFDDVLRSRAV